MNHNSESRRKLFLFGCLVICPILGILLVAAPMILISIFGIHKVPWSLAEQLPSTVVVLEEIADQSGMDSFFLVKARFSSEEEITEICNEFNLLANQDDVPPLSFAKLYDERHDVAWFPLVNTTRRYAFTTADRDGRPKENFETQGYEAVIWIDDERMEFVIQLAAL